MFLQALKLSADRSGRMVGFLRGRDSSVAYCVDVGLLGWQAVSGSVHSAK
jgi:hypothetical protein